ncbi:MAG TPA: hypothetical protein VF248_04525 [Nitrososphaeraceae archaeon]|jgi:hypothetical protein
MINRKSIDKVDKLLDLIDKHIREENCQHNPGELLQEYEKLTTV